MSSRKSTRPSRSSRGSTSASSRKPKEEERGNTSGGVTGSLAVELTARSRPKLDPNIAPADHLIALIKRLGGRTTKGILRIYRSWTASSNGLQFGDLKLKLHEHRLFLSDKDILRILRLWDRDGNDSLNFDDFLVGIKGKLNTARREKVTQAFQLLDEDGSGIIEFEEIKSKYNAKNHPDVKAGKKTEDEVLSQFVKVYEGDRSNGDNQITQEEFAEYYRGLSANIESDRMFVGMMDRSWDTKKVAKGVRLDQSGRKSARTVKPRPDIGKSRTTKTGNKTGRTTSERRGRERDSSRRPSSARSGGRDSRRDRDDRDRDRDRDSRDSRRDSRRK